MLLIRPLKSIDIWKRKSRRWSYSWSVHLTYLHSIIIDLIVSVFRNLRFKLFSDAPFRCRTGGRKYGSYCYQVSRDTATWSEAQLQVFTFNLKVSISRIHLRFLCLLITITVRTTRRNAGRDQDQGGQHFHCQSNQKSIS